MKKNTKIIYIVVGIVVAIGIFFGGVQVGKANTLNKSGMGMIQGNNQFGVNRQGRTGGRGMNANFVMGEILSKDATSITVKLQDSGSKIIFVASSTPVMKSTQGTLTDVSVGNIVTVTGSTNPDGSLTAQSIQLRPAGAVSQGGMPAGR